MENICFALDIWVNMKIFNDKPDEKIIFLMEVQTFLLVKVSMLSIDGINTICLTLKLCQ